MSSIQACLKYALLLTFAFYAVACGQQEDTAAETDAPVEVQAESIMGTWYVQMIDGELRQDFEESMRLVVEESGMIRIYEGSKEDEANPYTHDEEESFFQILDDEDATEVEASFTYEFDGDVLILNFQEGTREMLIELTRSPEGAERHQSLAAEEEAEEVIYGTWYLQEVDGQDVSVDEPQMRIVFEESGVVRSYIGDEQDDKNPFTHDAEEFRISIYDSRFQEVGEDDPDVVIDYHFDEGSLVLQQKEGSRQTMLLLTRDP